MRPEGVTIPTENAIRRQVRAEIIRTIAEANACGLGDGVAAARRAFPGIPEAILWECWSELDQEHQEAWWQRIERTIVGELIRNAVTTAQA
ncbi:hypothetical protein [Methylobacterium sp. E-046]|uniref:hypothetical protein n=1 Tax=Methylobacterium sp. E-046 TaxID=2836576 RepID=UPI001FB97A04|nr:hypothetical protein [Methylobacterium sp. E-046]MCJ2097997.1 hypothetical protein [Methylobacterium sp. E-046]